MLEDMLKVVCWKEFSLKNQVLPLKARYTGCIAMSVVCHLQIQKLPAICPYLKQLL